VKLLCKKDRSDGCFIDDSWKDFFLSEDDYSDDYYREMRIPEFKNRTTFIARDLLEISLYVYGADRTISREKEGIDCWKREIELNIPVRNIVLWQNNEGLLKKILDFLSGDVWNLHFRPYEVDIKKEIETPRLDLTNDVLSHIDSLCMLSGGLDSFIGAIDLLEARKKPLFISLHSRGKSSLPVQKHLQQCLTTKYSLKDTDFKSFYSAATNGCEDTMRTRSFMFFSHAIACASMFGRLVPLYIPENGFISINIPLTFSRIGSSSTRTTHPFYMNNFQTLLNNIKIPVTLTNPYQFSTKGEMISSCKNLEFLKLHIKNTVSCSHPEAGRWGKKSPKQCGCCYPCTIRRAAIFAAGIVDPSEYHNLDYMQNSAAKENMISYKYAIFSKLKENPLFTVQRSGTISDMKNIDKYASLYSRGLVEIESFINSL
jgi:7-cyano-7-deazaguanine synthase in queuosine biosynthesis